MPAMNYQRTNGISRNTPEENLIINLRHRVAVLETQLAQAQADKRVANETIQHVLKLMAEQQAQVLAQRNRLDPGAITTRLEIRIVRIGDMVEALNRRINNMSDFGAGCTNAASRGGMANRQMVNASNVPSSLTEVQGESSSDDTQHTFVNIEDTDTSRDGENASGTRAPSEEDRHVPSQSDYQPSLIVDQASSAASPWLGNQALHDEPLVEQIVHRTLFNSPQNPESGYAHDELYDDDDDCPLVGGESFRNETTYDAPESSRHAIERAGHEQDGTYQPRHTLDHRPIPGHGPFAPSYQAYNPHDIFAHADFRGVGIPERMPGFACFGTIFKPSGPLPEWHCLMVSITNIDPETRVQELLDKVRGGPVAKALLLDTVAMTGSLSALIIFAKSASAYGYAEFMQGNRVLLHGKRLHVALVRTPTSPMHTEGMWLWDTNDEVKQAEGLPSRCLEVKGFPRDRVKPGELKAAVNQHTHEWNGSLETLTMRDDGVLDMRFTTVFAARYALEQLEKWQYFGCQAHYARDPCAGDLEELLAPTAGNEGAVVPPGVDGGEHGTARDLSGELELIYPD